ncbi:MAG: 16S rRNA (adenine(1518)-N(6)/adenine(1519)-N(6))-dimethyltransferase RsmA [Clostridia bacterium]|nr:16S rRNA (adenine(1518)-N(6)/adenine(1519)-N(6))-dimethyltransferase RsmA [Clostridia bacterium]
MASYGLSAKKSLGQNFLNDMTVVRKIVDAASVGRTDLVLEVGPGLGVMTGVLAERAGYVAAIEIDRDLAPVLEPFCASRPNTRVIFDDVMRVNIPRLISEIRAEHPELERVRVVANLPYYITTPIIMMFLEQNAGLFDSLTFMVQKEVAERLVSGPDGDAYGAISVAVAYYSEASICFTVPASCFVPRPKVDSAVVNLDIYKERPVEPRDPGYMFKLVKAAFAQRRKMLVNALSNAAYLGLSKETAANAISSLGLDPKVRGEALSVADYARLSDFLLF